MIAVDDGGLITSVSPSWSQVAGVSLSQPSQMTRTIDIRRLPVLVCGERVAKMSQVSFKTGRVRARPPYRGHP